MIDWSQVVTPADKTAATRDADRTAIAARRWQAEVGGLTIGGMRVHTDERTRTNILGAYQEAMEDPEFTVQWKGSDGAFVTLDAPTIVMVAKAIRRHVQACFDREAQLQDDLTAGRPYNLDTGWPE